MWGSILCGIGAITIVTSVTMYFDYREEVATIEAIQSIANNMSRDFSRTFGGAPNPLNLDYRNDPDMNRAMSGSRNRALLVFLSGLVMSIGGSLLVRNGIKNN